jgi:hypothetical protein
MKTTLFVLCFLLCGCASSYRSIRPTGSYFPLSNEYSGLGFSYKMGVLAEHRNRKYAKREDKKAIRVVAVRIVNNTDKPMTVGQDFRFYSGNSELVLLDPYLVHRELKQGVPIYLLYLLLSPLQVYTWDGYGNTVESTPVGLVLGPGIAFGNMIGAGAANQHFLRDLTEYNMINKTIEPGKPTFGLIAIRDNGYNAINIGFPGGNEQTEAR